MNYSNLLRDSIYKIFKSLPKIKSVIKFLFYFACELLVYAYRNKRSLRIKPNNEFIEFYQKFKARVESIIVL